MATDVSAHELDAPPWTRVDGTLIATARALRQLYDRAMAEIGITLPEASVIAMVTERGAMTQTQLARALAVGRASLGERVDALVSRGLIERRPSTKDRRVWLVEATRRGRQLAGEVERIDESLRGPLRKGITRAERRQLASILLRVQQNIQELYRADR